MARPEQNPDVSENSFGENGIQKPTPLWGWQTFASLAIAFCLLAYMATLIDFRAVWIQISNCRWGFVLIGAACHYATYPIRGRRWRLCLGSTPNPVPKGKFGLVVFFYSFVDNLVPGKLGDLYAAHMARINFGVRRSEALGSLFFIRMVDAWVVLILGALSSWIVFSARLPAAVSWVLVGGLLLALAITAVLMSLMYAHKSMQDWLPVVVREMVAAFHGRIWPERKELPKIALLTAMIWVLEALWIYYLTLGFGLQLSPASVVFLAQVSLLASAFPFTPSGLGVVDVTLYGCLRLLDVPDDIAASLTVLNRLLDYWLHNALGLLTWAGRRVVGLRTWREDSNCTSAQREVSVPGPQQDQVGKQDDSKRSAAQGHLNRR